MVQPIVLVTFYCQSGLTERDALAAAVGAVQGRALIRLRRVPDVTHGDSGPTLLRMQKEYVPPKEPDVLGAHALIFAAPSGLTVSAPEWTSYFELLTMLADAGKLKGKVAAAVDGTHPSFTEALIRLGLIMVPPDTDSTALGRTVAAQARAMFA
jgi:hypothetical protein